MTKITNSKQRMLTGTVVSDKMTKTVVVEILTLKKHPKYKKYFKTTKRFKAHNPENQYHTGDKVVIGETKPVSKEKRWIVIHKVNNELKVNQVEG